LAGLIGYFVNPIVCRANLSGNPSFKAFLNQVRSTVLDAFKHQDYPFALLVERLQPTRDVSMSPLFQVMFVMQKAHLLHDEGMTALALGETGAKMNLGDLELESLALEQRIAQFDLTLTIAEVASELAGSLEYNTDLFDADTINRMTGHLQTLLEEIVTNPELPVSKLPLLTASERCQLVEWNQTQSSHPQDKCIHQLFEEQVERTPDAVAVVFEDLQFTYRELNTRANKLAHYLQQHGVEPEKLVGICIERSVEILVAFLGVLKAGGAYIPLDPRLPKQRSDSILLDSQLKVLITQEKLLAELPEGELHIVCLDRDWGTILQHKSDNPISAVHPQNLAYVMYTSGSTGQPKGVLIQHSSLVNHSCAIAKQYEINCSDRTLEFAIFSCDQAAEEIYPSWLSGATVVLRPDEVITSIADFIQFVEKEKLTVLNLPTPYWLEWTRTLSQLDVICPKSVRLVVVGMEKTQPEQLAIWRQHIGTDIKWYNAYGPTETTITATLYQPLPCAEKDITHCVPIGRSIANTQAYILDHNLQSVPIGVPGELYIGGFGLARGYLNHPELTAQKFIPNPFSNEPGARLYKTGDLVRYMSDGNIEFLGRIDNQVKIRGFRIELQEIEAVLTQHPQVQQTVVIARENQFKGKFLIAYVVPKKQDLTTSALRQFLNERLPEYMIPAIFVMLQALPFLPNGKINRRALPEPESLRPELNVAYVIPQTKIERLIAAVWQEMLQVEKVGIHDNFFELGGHSLLMVQIHSRLVESLEQISIIDMFKYPTIHSLAKHLKPKYIEEIIQENRSRSEIRSGRVDFRNQQKQVRQKSRTQINTKGYANE
jgi:amino acid adenylation domain-containing protein